MNIKEEKQYEKTMKVLDALQLTEKNRAIAENYMNVSLPENEELLKEVEHQSFKKEWKHEERYRCADYVIECRRKGFLEHAKRYVRFVIAVGGSTAYYVLYYPVYYTFEEDKIAEYATKAQIAAIKAEEFAWDYHKLTQLTEKIPEKDPEVLREAMDLCYHEYANTKFVLAGLSLHYEKPIEQIEDSIEYETKKKQIQETIDFMIDCTIATLPDMVTVASVKFSEEEIEVLKQFIETEEESSAIVKSNVVNTVKDKIFSNYMIRLHSGCMFLAIEHSKKFKHWLQLSMLMDTTITLDSCLHIHTKEWFETYIGSVPMETEQYLLWCVKNEMKESVKKISASYPELIKQVKKKMKKEDFLYLLNCVKEGNPSLYEEIGGSFLQEYQKKIAREIANNWDKESVLVEQYLLGEVEVDALYPFVKEWRDRIGFGRVHNEIISLKKSGNREMYQRGVVLMALGLLEYFFLDNWIAEEENRSKINQYANEYFARQVDKEQVNAIIKLLSKENLLVVYQLELLGSMYNYIYDEERKELFFNNCIEVLLVKEQEWKEDIITLAKEGTVQVRQLCIQVLNVHGNDYKEVLLDCAGDSSKQIQTLLITICTNHKEWEKEIKAFLTSKKLQEREFAVHVLRNWGINDYMEELVQVMEKEKSKKLKSLIQSYLGQADGLLQGEKTTEEIVEELLKGGRKRIVAWVEEAKAPVVHRLDGTEAPEDYRKAILVAYADMKCLGVNADAVKLAKELNPKELEVYMCHLFETWMKLGAEAKKRWVLYAVAIHGGEVIVPILQKQIQDWSLCARGAIASDAVKALALNGSSTALLVVDQMARKFKHKQVKAAANEALDKAAEQLGMTKAELEDKIVPNLEFNEQMERVFDYGSRTFVVSLTPSLELLITDEAGKKIKNLPTPAKKDDEKKAKEAYEAYKLLKKQLKTVVMNQKMRLEQALSNERLWSAKNWKELFVKNPVMHQFAIGLIWGRYEDGKLKETFRYMEDGSFNTMDEDEYEWNEEAMIGLVHPIELSEEQLDTWKEQLSDYEITQPIEQLEREVYYLTEEEKLQTELTRFGGKVLNSLSLSGKLLGFGWYRGSIQDAGCYFTFYKEDGELGVELEFSGASVGYEEDVTVYGVRFYKAGTVERGSYVYDTIKEEHLYSLCEVKERYVSEIMWQLTKATVSSVTQLKYPECKE